MIVFLTSNLPAAVDWVRRNYEILAYVPIEMRGRIRLLDNHDSHENDFRICTHEEQFRGLIVTRVIVVPVGPSPTPRLVRLAQSMVRTSRAYPSDIRNYGTEKFDDRRRK